MQLIAKIETQKMWDKRKYHTLKEQELRAHMPLVTRSEEPRAKSSYGVSSRKILRINTLL